MENHYVIRSLQGRKLNKFFIQLQDGFKIDEDTISSAFEKYHIGTDKNCNPIFWHLDTKLHLHNGTIDNIPIWNIKEQPTAIFGGHLLRYHINETVCICPTPQEAVIFDIYFPGKIWIAAETIYTMVQEIPLNAKVVLFPNDKKEWANHTSQYLKSIHIDVKTYNEKINANSCKASGPPPFEYRRPNFARFTPQLHKAIKSLRHLYSTTAQNDNLQNFMKELDLTIENIELT